MGGWWGVRVGRVEVGQRDSKRGKGRKRESERSQ